VGFEHLPGHGDLGVEIGAGLVERAVGEGVGGNNDVGAVGAFAQGGGVAGRANAGAVIDPGKSVRQAAQDPEPGGWVGPGVGGRLSREAERGGRAGKRTVTSSARGTRGGCGGVWPAG
jgi:hypothetical protein